jgi:hypothetical protein
VCTLCRSQKRVLLSERAELMRERAEYIAQLLAAQQLREEWEAAMEGAEADVLRERGEHAAALDALRREVAAARAETAAQVEARQQVRFGRAARRGRTAACADALACCHDIRPRAAAGVERMRLTPRRACPLVHASAGGAGALARARRHLLRQRDERGRGGARGERRRRSR